VAAIEALRGGELTASDRAQRDPLPRAIHDSAARGFDSAAEDYERGRPGYPAAAIELLVSELRIGPESTVVDLAAGTGKLTRALVPTGARLIAVEPVPGMRAQLERAVPTAEARAGTAEAIPVADGSADSVLVAQAFHWFDTPVTAREIHRVLRPGGGLGVIFNMWDESVDWVAGMQRIVGAHRGETPQRRTSAWREQLAATGLFTPLVERTMPHITYGDLDVLLARVASISFIATLTEPDRAELLEGVRAVVAGHPEAWRDDELAMPYVTQVTWCYAMADVADEVKG
jgi:SAM-dependent methyltransferase